MKLIYHKCGVGGDFYDFMSLKLFYAFIIQLFVSSFMEILISAYLNLKAPMFSKNGETLGVIVACLSLIGALIIMPAFYIGVVSRPMLDIENQEFRNKWGSFYSESNLSSRWSLIFNFTSILRRLMFIIFAFCVKIQSLQIISILVIN